MGYNTRCDVLCSPEDIYKGSERIFIFRLDLSEVWFVFHEALYKGTVYWQRRREIFKHYFFF